jgi:hypothetical protein
MSIEGEVSLILLCETCIDSDVKVLLIVQYYIPIGGGSEDFEVLVFTMKDRSIW